MPTRCKFTCVSVTKRKGWGEHAYVYDAELSAVHGGSPENDQFFAATPAGTIRLSTLRHDTFVVGADYYVDFDGVDGMARAPAA